MVGPLFQSHRRFSALLMFDLFDGQIQAQSYEASFAEDITADLTNFVRLHSDSKWTIYLAIFPHLVIQLKALILYFSFVS